MKGAAHALGAQDADVGRQLRVQRAGEHGPAPGRASCGRSPPAPARARRRPCDRRPPRSPGRPRSPPARPRGCPGSTFPRLAAASRRSPCRRRRASASGCASPARRHRRPGPETSEARPPPGRAGAAQAPVYNRPANRAREPRPASRRLSVRTHETRARRPRNALTAPEPSPASPSGWVGSAWPAPNVTGERHEPCNPPRRSARCLPPRPRREPAPLAWPGARSPRRVDGRRQPA